jgi:hypothetical protein
MSALAKTMNPGFRLLPACPVAVLAPARREGSGAPERRSVTTDADASAMPPAANASRRLVLAWSRGPAGKPMAAWMSVTD